VDYCTFVLEASYYPERFPRHYRIAYAPASKQLVIEADLPSIEAIPEFLLTDIFGLRTRLLLPPDLYPKGGISIIR
jgi:hypothetical protein